MSGSPARTARAAHQENRRHVKEVMAAAKKLGLYLVAVGYRPFGTPATMPWMPKTRYRAMRQTLSPRGALALDMMLMTATGQVSLDWSSEEDCAHKVSATARLTPLIVVSLRGPSAQNAVWRTPVAGLRQENADACGFGRGRIRQK